MKFYNPFKPHIVEYDGWYFVRKLPWCFMFSALDGKMWLYLDRFNDWHLKPYDPLCFIEEAKERLNYKKPAKFKPKVYIV